MVIFRQRRVAQVLLFDRAEDHQAWGCRPLNGWAGRCTSSDLPVRASVRMMDAIGWLSVDVREPPSEGEPAGVRYDYEIDLGEQRFDGTVEITRASGTTTRTVRGFRTRGRTDVLEDRMPATP